MGVGKLGLRERPKDIPSKQAAAAVGQCELMYTYDKLFSEYHHTVAQLLITGDDTTNDTRRFNFTNTLNRLLELGALPVINENDTVATDEIVIGDNDTLAAIVARSVHADMLILLSDIDGRTPPIPPHPPEATLLHHVARELTTTSGKLPGSAAPRRAPGNGHEAHAADICLGCGCKMVIANGNNPGNLYDILEGKTVGTTFSEERL